MNSARFLRILKRNLSCEKIRNIGIIAHIDAGKTTTTERMLYYVGHTDRIGNVDEGNTTTDYLPMERERGITIQSACIPLSWLGHRLNLIDTPGHVDFTLEVERSLRVLDGAVTILDGVAGVEAQTETVWKQANRYKIPRLIFVNKLDRDGANFSKSVESVSKRLSGWGIPIVTQLPLYSQGEGKFTCEDGLGSKLVGVVDIVNLEVLSFSANATGSVVKRQPISEYKCITQHAIDSRAKLVEVLSEADEELVEVALEFDMDYLKIPAARLISCIRKATISGKVIPVFCGASFRNIGVQPLLDGIVQYLPSPLDLSPPQALQRGKNVILKPNSKKLVALAFKVIYDKQKGMIVFVRIYSGTLTSRSVLKTATQPSMKERATKLLDLYADDFEEISDIETGNIGAVIGLKNVKTGDTLLEFSDKDDLACESIPIPPPVFVRSIEPAYPTNEKDFNEALDNLLREDPSLVLTKNQDTGQVLLSGMGELHLEIAEDRLKQIYKVNCTFGKVEISYRESISKSCVLSNEFHHCVDLLGITQECHIGLQVSPSDEDFEIDIPEPLIDGLFFEVDEVRNVIKEGVLGSLSRGPLVGFPVSHIRVELTSLKLISPEVSTLSAIRSAAQACLSQLLQKQTHLMEPIMEVDLIVPQSYTGPVVRDISGSRRGSVLEMNHQSDFDKNLIKATAPLSELIGYAKLIRSMTAGTGEWGMKLQGYELLPLSKEASVLKQIRGY